ncbi:hypothetical protein [Mucilaginibacter sp. CSA2-8R]|uniref:hypothetical protein n=1 Tax=Mucilaginibacter sp. CSA2-8R TaxID=3141542 RepID=UPI00315D8C22
MTAPNKRKSKIWLWILGILAVVGIAGYAGWHFLKKDLANPQSKVVKPLLTNQLKKMITEASDSLYHLTYDRFELNIDSGQGLITNFKLIPDSAVYKRLLAAHKAPNNVMHIRADSLILNSFGFIKTASGQRFNVRGVVLKHPVIRVVNKRLPYNDTSSGQKSSVMVKLMKHILTVSSVQKMVMQNLYFTWVNQNDGREKTTSFEHWNIRVDGFNTDRITARTNDTTGNKKTVFYKAKLVRIATPDSLYHLDFTDFAFTPMRRTLAVGSVELKPRLERNAFYQAVKYDKDRIHLLYKQVTMNHIDLARLINRQQFHIGSSIIGGFWGEVVNNYHWPKRKPPIRPYAYPHQKLQRLAFDLTIDTMLMHNGYFRYVIAARKSEENSVLLMKHTEGQYYNITNNAVAKKRNPFATIHSQTRVMGAGRMNLTYKFNLASAIGAFSCTARMGSMDGKAMNPLVKPLAMMEIKSGTINKMYMHLDADTHRATGNLDLYYANMKVNLLKRDDEADTLKKRGFISFFANAFMPNDNPKSNGKFRKGPINVIRDPHDSFFGLLWKSTLDGMSSAMMGFNQHKQKPNKNIVTKLLSKIIKPHKKGVKIQKDQ